MQNDSLLYDSIIERPLPKWLIEQKEGVFEILPKEIIMKEDNSLQISIILTTLFILITVFILGLYITKKYNKR